MRFLLSLAALPLAACPSDDSDATASATDDSTGADDDDDDDDDDGNTMSASMTEPDPDSSSSGPSTMTDPTESTGPEPTGSTGPEPTESTGPEPTTSTESGSDSDSSSESTLGSTETESESDTDSGTTGGLGMCTEDVEIPDLCATYEENFIGCYPEYAGYPVAYNCACNLLYAAPNYSGEDCVEAFEDYYACLGDTSCGEIMGECQDEAEALARPCSS